MSWTELARQLRGVIARGVIRRSADTGESQTVDVQAWAGHSRTDVEVLQLFGVSSRPPKNGVVILLAIGGDQSDLVALPAGSPGNRLGNLAEGEAALYAILGNRVHCKADGTVHVISPNKVLAEVKDNQVELTDDVIRLRKGTGESAPRVTITDDMVKLRLGDKWIVVQSDKIVSSHPIVIGPDPDPSV
ncbi:phage baseplate assembly protein domain-containing protein [Ancylobacter defluvii]|uniref:Bacteriophage Mu Gp45 N-terminal domain-containing protein n=1 Tax=Ancylobacter defluvii TaxID=1282440 RepID=A0A9W6JXH3_9HYPH|nr:phage baseplate assembly protein [Ancylobacter defluvii]MBS7586399.1 phage baseplate assembly protein [Ancylobacter defluvii]GLK85680.1 hypothetical protein GCM10017653_37500 [Ancylobacter defluvii]